MKGQKLSLMLRSFKHPNYRLFYMGQCISLIGTWMQNIALAWLVFRLTHSPLLLGLTTFLSQIPMLFVGQFGGVIADRFDKRKILVMAQSLLLLQAAMLAALTLSGNIEVWHILCLALCLGLVNAVEIPVRQSFVIEMVGKEDIINAIALNSTLFNSTRIVGPAVAGILIAAIGEGWCFFMNAVSFIAVIVGLLLMKLPKHRPSIAKVSAFTQIAEGFQYVKGMVTVRDLLFLLGAINLFGMPYTVLMPVFAVNILGRDSSGLGFLMAMTGVGALLGAILLSTKQNVRGLGRWILTANITASIALVSFSFSRFFPLSAVLLIPVGFSMFIQMGSINTLIQTIVPNHLRGRVMAFYAMMMLGMAPLGALLSGQLAQSIGAPTTIAINGLGCLIAGLFFSRRLPLLKKAVHTLLAAEIEPPAVVH